MFGRFFAAIRRLSEAAEGLADSLSEANTRFRANVLDGEAPLAERAEGRQVTPENGRPG